MFPASAYTGIVKRGIQKTIWQRRRGNVVTKPGILLLSMALVSCMLLTACADSSASPAGAKDRISRNHPARSAEAPQLRQPKSGNCWFASQWKKTLFWKAGATRLSLSATESEISTMEGKMNVQDLVLNLEAAGFEADGIEEHLACWRMGDIKEQLTLLSRQRAVILDRLHREEKQIDCLDYLVYQIGKGRVSA